MLLEREPPCAFLLPTSWIQFPSPAIFWAIIVCPLGLFFGGMWEGVGFSQGRWELGMWINTWQYPWGVSLPEPSIASQVGRSTWGTPQLQRDSLTWCREVTKDLQTVVLLQGFFSHPAQRSQQLPGWWHWSWGFRPWGWLGSSVGKRWQPAALQQWITTLSEGELAWGTVFVVIWTLWETYRDGYPSWMHEGKATLLALGLGCLGRSWVLEDEPILHSS